MAGPRRTAGLTFFLDLPDQPDTPCPGLEVVRAMNESLHMRQLSGNAYTGNKHEHGAILSQVLCVAVRPANDCEMCRLCPMSQSSRQASSGFHKKRQGQTPVVGVPPCDTEGMSGRPETDGGKPQIDVLSRPYLPRSGDRDVELEYVVQLGDGRPTHIFPERKVAEAVQTEISTCERCPDSKTNDDKESGMGTSYRDMPPQGDSGRESQEEMDSQKDLI